VTADRRCYTVSELLAALKMTQRTFTQLKAQGRLPFLEELKPRLGRRVRYRAEPIDRYLAGEWGRPHLAFGRKRRA